MDLGLPIDVERPMELYLLRDGSRVNECNKLKWHGGTRYVRIHPLGSSYGNPQNKTSRDLRGALVNLWISR